MSDMRDRLFNGKHSCVIAKVNSIRTFNQKGLKLSCYKYL